MRYTLEQDLVIFCAKQDCLQPHNGAPVKLRYLEKLLLQALLSNVNDKRDIIKYVWPKTVVGDGSYHKLVFDLRKQLKLSGLAPELIKTIPRRGLEFAGQWRILRVPLPPEDGDTASEQWPESPKSPEMPSISEYQKPRFKKWKLEERFSIIRNWSSYGIIGVKRIRKEVARSTPLILLMYFLSGSGAFLLSMVEGAAK